MRTTIRHIVARTYKPLLEKYLSRTRSYQYGDIHLKIPPEVFHPGFFFSTRLLLNYIKRLPLKGKKFLEPGCGSGLIALYAAQQEAIVTATDINPVAISFLEANSKRNQARLTIIESDLFDQVPPQEFDIIAINPPYYKKQPVSPIDYAWYCGLNGEFFSKLFEGLAQYIHASTLIYMVLFEGCDMEMIEKSAQKNGFRLDCVLTRQNLLEKNFIFKIEQIH